jgi:cyclin-dependent kinase 8/11
LSHQLISGVKYLHDHWILHRDLKPQNILVTQPVQGSATLKIADFGLARLFSSPLRSLEHDGVVVTIWYRAPELLLLSKHYTRAIDMWAVGCIIAELILCRALFPGNEVKKKGQLQEDQLKRIFMLLGKPSTREWPTISACKLYPDIAVWPAQDFKFRLHEHLKMDANNALFDLLLRLLQFDPTKRITAEEALKHRYFDEEPRPRKNAFECASGHIQRYPARKPAPQRPGEELAPQPIPMPPIPENQQSQPMHLPK